MCIKINYINKILENRFIPTRFRGYLLKVLTGKNFKKEFIVKCSLNGQNFYSGGIFGETESSLFSNFIKNEQKTIDFMNGLFNKNNIDIIIDVGSNTGQSLIIFKLLNKKCSVHCFEPFPQLQGSRLQFMDRSSS